MKDYIPVALFLAVLTAVGGVVLGLSRLAGPRRPSSRKEESYECGVPLFSNARLRVPVGFYLIALLFILFDVETLFLIPWALVVSEMGIAGLLEVITFTAVLLLGLVYLLRQKLLDEV
jgi:NADH-quinone oxidoreductase subunit A